MNADLIQNTLLKLGLNQNEILIYTALNSTGASSIADLQKQIKLPRTTIVENLERLKDKGLIYTTFEGKNKKLAAEDSKKLKLILEEKILKNDSEKKELKTLNLNISKTIDSLTNLKLEDMPELDIRYYRGHDQISKVYDEVLKHNDIKTYADISEILEFFPENSDKFLKAVKAGVNLWDITTFSQQAFKEKEVYGGIKNHFFKFFPEGFKFKPMDYLITESGITIITGGKQVEAIVINSKILAENAMMTYDLLWSFLPEVNS